MASFKDVKKVAKQYGQGGDDWFKAPLGESKVRVLTAGFEVLAKHYNPLTKKSLTCVGIEKGCPEHRTNSPKQTVQYLVYLIDRADSQIKVGQLPYKVASAIGKLQESTEYGFEEVPPYDITIIKTSTGPEAKDVEYTVAAARKDSPLTKAEEEAFAKKKPLSEIVDRMKEKVLKTMEPLQPKEETVDDDTEVVEAE